MSKKQTKQAQPVHSAQDMGNVINSVLTQKLVLWFQKLPSFLQIIVGLFSIIFPWLLANHFLDTKVLTDRLYQWITHQYTVEVYANPQAKTEISDRPEEVAWPCFAWQNTGLYLKQGEGFKLTKVDGFWRIGISNRNRGGEHYPALNETGIAHGHKNSGNHFFQNISETYPQPEEADTYPVANAAAGALVATISDAIDPISLEDPKLGQPFQLKKSLNYQPALTSGYLYVSMNDNGNTNPESYNIGFCDNTGMLRLTLDKELSLSFRR